MGSVRVRRTNVSLYARFEVIIIASRVARPRLRRRMTGVSAGVCTASAPSRSTPSSSGSHTVRPVVSDSSTRSDWVR